MGYTGLAVRPHDWIAQVHLGRLYLNLLVKQAQTYLVGSALQIGNISALPFNSEFVQSAQKGLCRCDRPTAFLMSQS
jgi:hypothetical protein